MAASPSSYTASQLDLTAWAIGLTGALTWGSAIVIVVRLLTGGL